MIHEDVGLVDVMQHRLAVSGEILFWSRPQAYEVCKQDPGESAEVVYTHDPPASPTTLAANEDYLFWSTAESLHRCELPDCTNPVEVAPISSGEAAPSIAAGTGEEVYWIDGLDSDPGDVRSCSGLCPGGGDDVATGLNRPRSLALDATHVYFSAHGEPDSYDGLIWRATRSDPSGTAEVYLAGIRDPAALAIADGYLYYTVDLAQGQLFRCPIGETGCDPQEEITPNPPVAAPEVTVPLGLAVDDAHVYWSNAGVNQSVLSCPRSGCGDGSTYPTVLGSGYDYPGSVTLSDACVFWSVANPTGESVNGAVYAMARPN